MSENDKAPRPGGIERFQRARPEVPHLVYMERAREICAYALRLEKQLSTCNGTFQGELDGRPAPGTINDGTDAACPGWWRGHDHGCEGMKKKYKKIVAGLLPMTDFLDGLNLLPCPYDTPVAAQNTGTLKAGQIRDAQAARSAVDAEKEGGGE